MRDDKHVHKLVMPGLVPGIHVAIGCTWLAGTSPAMTTRRCSGV